jgi:hypothetical protein
LEELFAEPSIVATAETESSDMFLFSLKYMPTDGVIEGV